MPNPVPGMGIYTSGLCCLFINCRINRGEGRASIPPGKMCSSEILELPVFFHLSKFIYQLIHIVVVVTHAFEVSHCCCVPVLLREIGVPR